MGLGLELDLAGILLLDELDEELDQVRRAVHGRDSAARRRRRHAEALAEFRIEVVQESHLSWARRAAAAPTASALSTASTAPGARAARRLPIVACLTGTAEGKFDRSGGGLLALGILVIRHRRVIGEQLDDIRVPNYRVLVAVQVAARGLVLVASK